MAIKIYKYVDNNTVDYTNDVSLFYSFTNEKNFGIKLGDFYT